MFYITGNCPICSNGIIGICRCDDQVRLALLCKDCHSLWLEPQQVTAVKAQFPPHAGVQGDTPHHWASQGEIELRGWFEWISGELVAQ